ncbi:uncharacterized protein LOC114956762 [Acropora millepora]|uniref:uncharacterized protein LOC114956762 n=1 Tax=Acropora millepora TaxID=45264 RepID=UPI001CF571D5|nr:uncharacterized protein LOC114956762 [Acropora millepora]
MAFKIVMLALCLIHLGYSCPTPPSVNAELIFHPFSCLDYLKRGLCNSSCGVYKLYGSNGNSFPAYCDFQSEPGTAWTLVMSWSHAHRALAPFQSTPFSVNSPVNENAQNWKMYRLSLARMRSLQSHSTHWRATCSYPTHGVDFRDYVRGNFKDFDIVNYIGAGQCKKAEFVSIRGHNGMHQTVHFSQRKDTWGLHIDSSYANCQFKPSSGAVGSEDNFGFYGSTNPKFRCSKDDQSTTQWWFGAHL